MPINLYSNHGHNNVGGHISKNVAKIANNCFKISRAATFGQSLGGHNLAIFYPILTFDHTKMISLLRRVQWLHLIPFIFWYFEPLFATCGHIGRTDAKVLPGCGTCPAYHHKLPPPPPL